MTTTTGRINHKAECSHEGTAKARRACRAMRFGAPGQHTLQSWFEGIERKAVGSRAYNLDSYFAVNGVGYQGTPVEMTGGPAQERTEANFEGFVQQGLKGNSIIWACERLRTKVFCQIRFMWQEMNDRRPGALTGGVETRLELLDEPWPNGTTADLLARVRLHADLAGNAYIVKRQQADGSYALRILRPDWVTLVLGSNGTPSADPNDVDTETVGYAYWPGGIRSGRDPEIFLPDEVSHYAPMPDPIAHYRGMSWLNPVIDELMADQAATRHKAQFFQNGAVGGVVVMVDKDMDQDAFGRWMRKFNGETQGLNNAYKTWYVTGGMDVKTLTSDMRQLDFKITQGAGETRIAAAAGTPPILVGLSEGLNAGQYNIYSQAKRSFVDGEVRPDWMNLCASLQSIIRPPNGKRLWYDDRDIPYLREDRKDLAEIMQMEMAAVETGLRAGFEADAVVEAVAAGDIRLLLGKQSGLFSVQLQPPGSGTVATAPALATAAVETAGAEADTASATSKGGQTGAVPQNGSGGGGKVNGKQPALAGAGGGRK
jgi:HK97 family phage portal protein